MHYSYKIEGFRFNGSNFSFFSNKLCTENILTGFVRMLEKHLQNMCRVIELCGLSNVNVVVVVVMMEW